MLSFLELILIHQVIYAAKISHLIVIRSDHYIIYAPTAKSVLITRPSVVIVSELEHLLAVLQ